MKMHLYNPLDLMPVMLYSSPLGNILLKADGTCLTEVSFSIPEVSLQGYTSVSLHDKASQNVFRQSAFWLDTYFRGEDPGRIPPVCLCGTPFRRLVWQILQNIPYGHTVTYKEVAHEVIRRTGVERMAAQAIGNAVKHNPVAIFIPCHRVVGVGGQLTGYAYGVDRKEALLRLEHGYIPRQLKA